MPTSGGTVRADRSEAWRMAVEENLYDVRVWHTIIESEFRFTILSRSDQRARLAARELFPKELLDRRVLRVACVVAGSAHPARASWEPL